MAANEDFKKEERVKLKPKFKTKRFFLTASSTDGKDQILTSSFNEMSKSFANNDYLSPYGTNTSPLGGVVYMMNEMKDDLVDIHSEISRSVYVSQVSEYSNIATASVGRISSSLVPNKEDKYYLGSSSREWHTTYMLTASIGGGIFTSASLAAGGGSTDLTAVDSHIVPDGDNTRDLGSSTKEFKNLYIDGVAYIDTLNGTRLTAPIRHVFEQLTKLKSSTLDGTSVEIFEFNIAKAVTVDLITPAHPGQIVTIINIGSGAVTITGASSPKATGIYNAKGANYTINQNQVLRFIVNSNEIWYVL